MFRLSGLGGWGVRVEVSRILVEMTSTQTGRWWYRLVVARAVAVVVAGAGAAAAAALRLLEANIVWGLDLLKRMATSFV